MTAIPSVVFGIVNAVALFPSFVDAKPRSVDYKAKRERFTDI
jgi:ABC-type phosphate transport system permease subunit